MSTSPLTILPWCDTVSALLTAELSVNAALWRVETMEPSGSSFLYCVIVGQQTLCAFFVLLFFFVWLHFRLSLSKARKATSKNGQSPLHTSFWLSWIMATISKDSIKLHMFYHTPACWAELKMSLFNGNQGVFEDLVLDICTNLTAVEKEINFCLSKWK